MRPGARRALAAALARRGSRPGSFSAAPALAKGFEVASTVNASSREFMRVRRDAAEIAARRRRAAVRRRGLWTAATVVGLAGAAGVAVTIAQDGLTATATATAVLVLALLIWAVTGLVRAVAVLRRSSRVVAALPPPQPGRPAVAPGIRSEIARLNDYSDGLRSLVSASAAGSVSGRSTAPPGPLAVQLRDVVMAADQAERQLRQLAQDYTGLARTGTRAPGASAASTAGLLAGEIGAGVAHYGQLVEATAAVTSAAAALQAGAPSTTVVPAPDRKAIGGGAAGQSPTGELQEQIERLRALALGLRELAGPAD